MTTQCSKGVFNFLCWVVTAYALVLLAMKCFDNPWELAPALLSVSLVLLQFVAEQRPRHMWRYLLILLPLPPILGALIAFDLDRAVTTIVMGFAGTMAFIQPFRFRAMERERAVATS